jgi:hypothetical protein
MHTLRMAHMKRISILTVSALMALALCVPDAEARGRRGGSGKSHSSHVSTSSHSATKSPGKTPSRKAERAVNINIKVPVAKAAPAQTSRTNAARSTAAETQRPLQQQTPTTPNNGISELCLLPAADPKRPASCALMENLGAPALR